MGQVLVSGKFERVAMDLLDVSVISGKGHNYILVVCDYFTKYTSISVNRQDRVLCGRRADG